MAMTVLENDTTRFDVDRRIHRWHSHVATRVGTHTTSAEAIPTFSPPLTISCSKERKPASVKYPKESLTKLSFRETGGRPSQGIARETGRSGKVP